MTDTRMLAFAFLIGGGAVVAVGIGALVTYLHARFDRFQEYHRDEAEGRAYLLARIEEGIAQAARATMYAADVRSAIRYRERLHERATISRAATDRHAASLRLRRARTRGGRKR